MTASLADAPGFDAIPAAASKASNPHVVERTIDLLRATGSLRALLPSARTVEFLNLLLLALGIVPSPCGGISPKQIPMNPDRLWCAFLRCFQFADASRKITTRN